MSGLKPKHHGGGGYDLLICVRRKDRSPVGERGENEREDKDDGDMQMVQENSRP